MPATGRTTTILLTITATILIGWVLRVGAGLLQPLVIALLLANLLQPVVRRLAAWHIHPAVTVFTLTGLLFVLLVQVGVLLQANVMRFLGVKPTSPAFEHTDPLSEGQEAASVGFDWSKVVANIEGRLEDSALPEQLSSLIVTGLAELNVTGLATGVLNSSVGFTRSLVLIMIYMIFIFAEQSVFQNKILAVAGNRREDAKEVLDTIGRGIQKYLGVKTLISLMTGALCYFGLVVLQVPYALLFGVLTFLLNYIPTFGSIIASIFPTLTALALKDSWTPAVYVLIIYLAVNMSLGQFLEPRILGRELRLSPLVIIISVVFWATMWGVVGAFLAVPITASMQTIFLSNEKTRPIAVMLASTPPSDWSEERRPPGKGAGAEAA